MLKFPKFMTALAVAAALGPFAASARSDRAPVQAPAHQEYLFGQYGGGQSVANSGGRAAASNVPAGLFTIDATQYAAVNTLANEN